MDTGGSKRKYAAFRQFAGLTSIPTLLLVGPLVGYGIGVVLDRVFLTAPWLTSIFLLLGLISGARQTWLIIQRVSHDDTHEKS